MSPVARLYARLARAVMAHDRLVAAAAVAVTAVALALGVPPDIDANLLNLLPASDPDVAAVRALDEQEGGADLLTLAFEPVTPEAADGLDAFLDGLVEDFEALPDVVFALHEVDAQLAQQIALMQLDPAELTELHRRLQGALALGPALNPMVARRLMDMGEVTDRIAKADGAALLAANGGEGKLFVRPSQPASDPQFARRFMADAHRILDAADPAAHGLRITWTGGAYHHTVEDVAGIGRDMVRTSVGSVLLVLGILLIAFRSPRALLVVFPPLVVANAINLAFVAVFLGALNTYTSFGTAILFGLGIDFAIHLVGRYRELHAAGVEVEEAIAQAWALTGPPSTTAALTSAAGFLALATARFAGFAQLGVLLAVGLMVCLTSMLVLLPVLIAWFDRKPVALLGLGNGSGLPSRSTYRAALPGAVLLFLGAGTVAFNVIPRLPFEYDLSALRSDGKAFEELDADEQVLANQSYAPVVVSYDDEASARADLAALEAAVADGSLPHVRTVVSLFHVLPDDQEARNAAIRDLVADAEHPSLRYLPPPIANPLARLRGLQVRTLTRDSLPAGLLHLVGAGRDDVHRLLVMPEGNMWDVRNARALRDDLRAVLPGRAIASGYLGVSAMFLLAMEDVPKVALLALIFVTLLAWLDLRRIHWTFAAVGTLVVGMVWAGGALQVAGVKLSLVNLSGLPILLGIGVDVVIHLAHRLREEGPGGVRRALRTTGVAAGLSTLTTVGSFLSLTLAGNRGVRGLGVLVVVGLITVTIVGFTLLTALWAAGWRMTGRAPSQAGPST